MLRLKWAGKMGANGHSHDHESHLRCPHPGLHTITYESHCQHSFHQARDLKCPFKIHLYQPWTLFSISLGNAWIWHCEEQSSLIVLLENSEARSSRRTWLRYETGSIQRVKVLTNLNPYVHMGSNVIFEFEMKTSDGISHESVKLGDGASIDLESRPGPLASD